MSGGSRLYQGGVGPVLRGIIRVVSAEADAPSMVRIAPAVSHGAPIAANAERF